MPRNRTRCPASHLKVAGQTSCMVTFKCRPPPLFLLHYRRHLNTKIIGKKLQITAPLRMTSRRNVHLRLKKWRDLHFHRTLFRQWQSTAGKSSSNGRSLSCMSSMLSLTSCSLEDKGVNEIVTACHVADFDTVNIVYTAQAPSGNHLWRTCKANERLKRLCNGCQERIKSSGMSQTAASLPPPPWAAASAMVDDEHDENYDESVKYDCYGEKYIMNETATTDNK